MGCNNFLWCVLQKCFLLRICTKRRKKNKKIQKNRRRKKLMRDQIHNKCCGCSSSNFNMVNDIICNYSIK